MKIYNYPVDKGEVAHIADNIFSFTPCNLGSYGFFPKFEITKDMAYIVEYKPRGFLLSLLFNNKYFSPKKLFKIISLGDVDDLNSKKWIKLYRERELLGYKIKGGWFSTKRIDSFNIDYNQYTSDTVTHVYNISIESTVDPQKLYYFLNIHNGEEKNNLLSYIKTEIRNEINKIINNEFKNPAINETIEGHCFTNLEEMGFNINTLKIQYSSSSQSKNVTQKTDSSLFI